MERIDLRPCLLLLLLDERYHNMKTYRSCNIINKLHVIFYMYEVDHVIWENYYTKFIIYMHDPIM